jgi:hypothetical protein
VLVAALVVLIVTPLSDAAPTVTTPVISGTAQEGQTLTAAASSGQKRQPGQLHLVQLGRQLHQPDRQRFDIACTSRADDVVPVPYAALSTI